MSEVFKMAPTWKSKVEELKRKYVRGTFRNTSYLRKDFTTVEDDEEIHKLVMVAVAQHMNLLTTLFTREINRGI